MDCHLDVSLLAGRHDCFKEILQIIPEFFFGDRCISFEKLIKLCHTLRLPARERHVVLLREAHDVFRHGLIIALDHVFLIEQSRGAVSYRMEQICTRPVKNRHEVVADYLDAELAEVQDALLIILDQGVSCRQADLDIVVNIDRLNDLRIETVSVDLIYYLTYLILFPDFTGHLVVQSPDNACNSGDLFDVTQSDRVVTFAVPTPSHFHWHILPSLFCGISSP